MLEGTSEALMNFKSKKEKPDRCKRICILAAALVAFICLFMVLFHVTPKSSYFSYELGESVSLSKDTYLKGLKWAVNLSKLDLSGVNESKVGNYKAHIKHGFFQKFDYTIEILDTTPPEVEVFSDFVPLLRMEEYVYSNFVSRFSDLSGEVSFSFDTKDDFIVVSNDRKAVFGRRIGDGKIDIIASDPSGNKTVVTIRTFVDDPPIIEGVEEYYVAVGSKVSFSDGVTSYDETDGPIDCIEVTVDSAYEENVGDYEVLYEAKDSFGFVSSESSTVHVMEPLELQNLINTHDLPGNSNHVIGAINPYDMGISVNNDIEQVEALIRPTLVHIRKDYPGGAYVHGSGYIISITDDEVIICTNKHVVNDMDTMDIYFFDGSRVVGKTVASISVPDIAFMSVSKDSIKEVTMSELRTIHLNTPYFNSLEDKPETDIVIRSNHKDGSVWKLEEGKIIRKSGVLSQYYAGFDYPVTQIDLDLVGGMSGSPVVDETGSLMCMAVFKWFNGSYTEYYGVKVTDIVAYYKEVFGKDADYYIAYQ